MEQRSRWVLVLAGASALFASFVWFSTLKQPLIDAYEFRQTQTALSALFMQPGLDGLLNYQTPVLGAPWSIPFEFPLFQWVAYQLANLSGLGLSSSGRLVSVLFGMGCLWPSTRLMRHFGLSFTTAGLFVALYCTSSIYLYWNRAFLMESMALFFTLMSLDLYSQLRHKVSTPSVYLLALAFATSLSAGLLVKATTAIPALILMAGDWIWQSRTALIRRKALPQQLLIGSAMAVAFVLLYSWTHHADALKLLNPIGSRLTSSALRSWNFGQASQRIQAELWQVVLLQRMLTPVAAFPISALLAGGLWMSGKPVRYFLLACLFLAITPLVFFTNLHIVHSYYQAGNQIFLLMAVAGSATSILDHADRKAIKLVLVVAALSITISANLNSFFKDYWPQALNTNSEKLEIGKLLQKHTPMSSAIIVFGDDWSSAFAYHSQRRSFTLPEWPQLGISIADALNKHEQYLKGASLGAIVSKKKIDSNDLPSTCRGVQHTNGIWQIYLCETTNGTKH